MKHICDGKKHIALHGNFHIAWRCRFFWWWWSWRLDRRWWFWMSVIVSHFDTRNELYILYEVRMEILNFKMHSKSWNRIIKRAFLFLTDKCKIKIVSDDSVSLPFLYEFIWVFHYNANDEDSKKNDISESRNISNIWTQINRIQHNSIQ